MTQELSVAFVGAGRIAGGFDEDRLPGKRGIFSHAGAYREAGKFRFACVVDSKPERARAFQQYWGVENVAADVRVLFDKFHDVISVCTPDETHYRLTADIVKAGCCKTVFLEKPLALTLMESNELCTLVDRSGVNVVVNFQRRFEPVHIATSREITAAPQNLNAVNGYYMKGLRHNGVTMLDTLSFLCGMPGAVLAYNRVYNQEVGGYSYEFVLYYDGWNTTVKTVDAMLSRYDYHIFEIDLLFANKRLTFVENSSSLRTAIVGEFAYSGVRTIQDAASKTAPTGLDRAMVGAAQYVYDITVGKRQHSVNTPRSAYNSAVLAEKIEQSFEQGMIKLAIEPSEWKK